MPLLWPKGPPESAVSTQRLQMRALWREWSHSGHMPPTCQGGADCKGRARANGRVGVGLPLHELPKVADPMGVAQEVVGMPALRKPRRGTSVAPEGSASQKGNDKTVRCSIYSESDTESIGAQERGQAEVSVAGLGELGGPCAQNDRPQDTDPDGSRAGSSSGRWRQQARPPKSDSPRGSRPSQRRGRTLPGPSRN